MSRGARLTPYWEPVATAAFLRHAQRYITCRLRAQLRAAGHAFGRFALRTWLRRRGLRALSTRPQRPCTTVADPAVVVDKNMLLGQSVATAPNQLWVGNITYLLLVGGRWCYLAIWRDTYSRCVIGCHLDWQMPAELALTALEQVLTLRQPVPDLIIHANHCSKYISLAWWMYIEKAQALASFSRPGNTYDNI